MARLGPDQKVFGLGLSRTGTTSLGKALNELEIRTKDYPHDRTTQRELFSGSGRLTSLNRYQGIVDITVVPFYRQLDRAYPSSKFILTVRDRQSWLESIRRQYTIMAEAWSRLDPQFKEFTRLISERVYGSLQFDAERFLDAYERHARNVLNDFKDRPADLLVMDISGGDGWEKLCPFLGLPVPSAPFPHVNQGQPVLDWYNSRAAVKADLEGLIPSGRSFILVDDCKLDVEAVGDGRVLPFLERDGCYSGTPADDATAISELQRMREAGTDFIAFAWVAFWWLNHYVEFARYLRSNFATLVANDRLIVFDLRR